MMSYNRLRKINTWYDRSLFFFLALSFWFGMNHVGRNLGGSGIELPYNIFFIIGIVVFALFAVFKIALTSRINIPKPYWLVVISALLIVFPLLYVNRVLLDTAMERFYGLAVGLFYLLLLYQLTSFRSKKVVLMILFLSTLIQTFWGLLQFYFIYESQVLFYRADLGQPYGVFQQINDYGSYLAVGSVMALYYAFYAKQQVIWKYIAATLLVFANTHLTELALAETGKIVNLVSVFVYLAFVAYDKKQVTKPVVILAVCIISAIIPRELVHFRPHPSEYFLPGQQVAKPVTASDAVNQVTKQSELSAPKQGDNIWWRLLGTRSVIYPITIKMIIEHPWVGVGPGAFTKQYLLHQGEYLKQYPDAPAEFNLDHPHNEILYWVVELGLFSALGFLLLVCGCWWLSFRGIIDWRLLLIGLPLIVHSMLELPLYHSAPHAFLLVSLFFVATRSTKVLRIKLPKFSKLLIVPVAIWAFVQIQMFMLSTVYALQMFLLFNKSNKTHIKLLTSINNPAAFKLRREFEILQYRLRKAKESGNISFNDLQSFLYWSYSTIQYAPLEVTYQNFVEGLRLGGKHIQALKYAKEANLMYPRNEKFKEYIDFYHKRSDLISSKPKAVDQKEGRNE
ncbi:PglL family O-oligosaccharyltransferase [Alteromonas sp. a30]|uniref:PglL family O-oligosaccharyltransferase n=1 Tax=Alteromonas sp. a30 TaxID=2730917 RepID=UPI00227E74EF|nr:Wzy polymerase domain-containing protein [Alteromonas sp. a30]MCY7294369.1 hypothetical protein [Alteromonas sp. a30]